MSDLSWMVTIQDTGKPPINASAAAQPVDAVGTVDVAIEPGDADKVVTLQPGDAASIRLLVIKSSRYGDAFTYKVSDGVTDSDAVTLDAPQLFTRGSVALFGLAPLQLKLSNTSLDQTANVEIFVARDATP